LKPKRRAVIKSLTSVPDVGKVVATTFHTERFRPERFNRGEEVASYLGLAPTVRYSREKTARGSLVPVEQTFLRSLLIEAAWMWRAKDPYARELYNKLVSKTGIPQQAKAALACRLAIILWRLSIEQSAYTSFRAARVQPFVTLGGGQEKVRLFGRTESVLGAIWRE
jgi:transposase